MYYIVISLEGDSFFVTYYCAGTSCTAGWIRHDFFSPIYTLSEFIPTFDLTCSIFSEIVVFLRLLFLIVTIYNFSKLKIIRKNKNM